MPHHHSPHRACLGAAVNHIGAISGGKDSVAMAMLLTETCPDTEFQWICTPTGNEPPEWFAHMARMRERIGPITPLVAHGGLDGLIQKYNSLPSWRQRWCTRQLKIEPFAAYVSKRAPARVYVGLRADEEEREGGDYHRHMRDVEMVFPLRNAGMGLSDVLAFNAERDVEIPERTDCMLCFFQRLDEWWSLWRNQPEEYAKGVAYEVATGHTFRSPGRDTQPTSLADLEQKFKTGWVPPRNRQGEMFRGMQCRVCRL
jgi:3'-phosphoadenosine 5'-phosphosulfate sulfotransferase (PAPS reductase)/FAD synthetase